VPGINDRNVKDRYNLTMKDKFSRKKKSNKKRSVVFSDLDFQLQQAVETLKKNQYQLALALLDKVLSASDPLYPLSLSC